MSLPWLCSHFQISILYSPRPWRRVEVCYRTSGGYVYRDIDIESEQCYRSRSLQLDRILCMSTVDMLYIMWMLKHPPKIPELQLECELLVQDFYIHLANQASMFMNGLADNLRKNKIKGMMISIIRPGVGSAKDLPLVSSYKRFNA